jgi:L-ascorbate metabolism protein UlaG (beta-lactamase superfamily)
MSAETGQSLEDQIRELDVAPGTVACVWLGQASYLFKSPEGVIVMLDPYLSDYAEEQWGLKRAFPAPIDPAVLHPEVLLITHWHEDHMDVPSIKKWIKPLTGDTGLFIGPPICTTRASYQHMDVRVTATFARHDTPEAPAPDAIGFLLDIGGVRIWNVGDTEYDAHLRPMREEQIDVALIPINGVGGNLNANEAAFLLWHVQPKIAVPNHYNLWAPESFGPGATLDPQAFISMASRLGATFETHILTVGEIVTLP